MPWCYNLDVGLKMNGMNGIIDIILLHLVFYFFFFFYYSFSMLFDYTDNRRGGVKI